MEIKSENQFLSTTELARLLGVSRVTVFKKIKSGEIKAHRAGRNFVVNKNDLFSVSGKVLTANNKRFIEEAVRKTVREYGETLRLLGKE